MLPGRNMFRQSVRRFAARPGRGTLIDGPDRPAIWPFYRARALCDAKPRFIYAERARGQRVRDIAEIAFGSDGNAPVSLPGSNWRNSATRRSAYST